MRMRVSVVGLVGSVIVLVVDGSPACKPYNNTLRDGSLGFCAGVVNYEYYASDASQPQEDLEQVAKNAVMGSEFQASIVSMLPSGCQGALKKTACLGTFPRCDYMDASVIVSDAQTAAALHGSPEMCNQNNMTHNGAKCFKTLPRMFCKASGCFNDLLSSNDSKSKCPIVDGLFYKAIIEKMNDAQVPDYVKTDLLVVLGSGSLNGCGTNCATTLFGLNLMSLLGFSATCDKKIQTGQGEIELYPSDKQSYAANFLQFADAAQADETLLDGLKKFDNSSLTESDIRAFVDCADGSGVKASVQSSFQVVPDDSLCASVTRSPENNDKMQGLIHKLSSVDASFQADTNKATCLSSQKLKVYPGLYFVPPFPGMTPLAARLDQDGKEKAWPSNWDDESCPVRTQTSPYMGNFGDSVPLCEIGGRKFYNARDCTEQAVESKLRQVPKFVSARCTAAIRELTCASGYMKLEEKSLCLVPDQFGGCDARPDQRRRAFGYALPRFPKRSMCEKVNEECAAFYAYAKMPNLTCSEVINVTSCESKGLKSLSEWGCSSSLNGRPKYPEGAQQFGDISALMNGPLRTYLDALRDASLTLASFPAADANELLFSDTVNPTASKALYADKSDPVVKELQEAFCSCPYPLVVPDDPNAPTIEPFCCQLPCRGSMHSEDDMQLFTTLQLVLSSIGLVCSIFMILTWGLFKEKHKQFMTFWISICSFMVTLGFFIGSMYSLSQDKDLTGTLCTDNTQPNTIHNGFSICVLQAAFVAFFASAECGWWCVQSFDLFRKLVLGQRSNTDMRLIYHAFAWTPAIVTLSYFAAGEKLGYAQPSPYCLVNADTSTMEEWLGFYGFIGFCFVAGSIMMLCVIVVIIRHATKAQLHKTSGSSGVANIRRQYRMYRTPFLFVLLFILVWANVFTFRANATVYEADYAVQGAAWVGCLLQNFGAGIVDPARNSSADVTKLINPPPGEGCRVTQGGINDASINMVFVLVMSQSILIFLVFGTADENYRLWLEAFGCRDFADRSTKFTENSKTEEGKDGVKTNNDSFYGSQSAPSSQAASQPYSFFKNVNAPSGNAPVAPSSLHGSYY